MTYRPLCVKSGVPGSGVGAGGRAANLIDVIYGFDLRKGVFREIVAGVARYIHHHAERAPAKRVRNADAGDGYFFPGEVARMLHLEGIDYTQLRTMFRLVRKQRSAPVAPGWSRFSLIDLACFEALLEISGGRTALEPRRKLSLRGVEETCAALRDLGYRYFRGMNGDQGNLPAARSVSLVDSDGLTRRMEGGAQRIRVRRPICERTWCCSAGGSTRPSVCRSRRSESRRGDLVGHQNLQRRSRSRRRTAARTRIVRAARGRDASQRYGSLPLVRLTATRPRPSTMPGVAVGSKAIPLPPPSSP